jgi:hypothetical protein
MDYSALLYDPIYLIQGVPATLTFADATTLDVTVLDKTSGVECGENGQVSTILPCACLRVPELKNAGYDLGELDRAELLMNDYTWKVTDYKFRPAPTGQNQGEVLLILTGQKPVESESE